MLTHINALTLSAAFLAITFFSWVGFRKFGKSSRQWTVSLLAVAVAGFVTTAVWFAFWND